MRYINQFVNLGNNSIETHYYFFNENDDLLRYFISNNISISLKYLEVISKTQFINRIGYYQIALSKTKFIKIYILPKIYYISGSKSIEELIKDFNKYFKEYLRLRKLYQLNNGNQLKVDNIIDLNFSIQSDDINEFIKRKYITVLNSIYHFFKSNHFKNQIKEKYYSNDINGQIDFKRNVIEINKSRVHQIDKSEISESILATITLNVIKDFIKYKFVYLQDDELDNKIKSLTNSIKNYISYNFSNLKNLNNNQISTYFNSGYFTKNDKRKSLKDNLLILKGWESHHDFHKLNNLESIWFSSEYMYEMKVLDFISNIGCSFNTKVSKEYFVQHNNVSLSKGYSIPDFILEKENTTYIIDAKWKVIESFDEIDIMDVLKAHRDLQIHGNNTSKIILIYPKININENLYLDKELELSYSSEIKFIISEIPLL